MTPQIKHGLLCLAGIVLCVCELNAQVIVSVQDGDWSSSSTWSGGIVPVSGNSSQVTIDHQVTLSPGSTLSIDDVTVNGSLTIGVNAEVTILNGSLAGDISLSPTGVLNVYGTIVCNNGAALTGTTVSNSTFFNGSTYQHLSTAEGIIPLANWQPESTFEILGFTGNLTMQSSNWGQTFGTLIYDCPNQGTSIEFKGLLAHIAGDFIVRNTNLNILRLAQAQTLNLQIDGNVLIEGPSEIWFGMSGNSVVTVNGNFTYNSTSGASSYFTTTGQNTFSIMGNFAMNAEHRIKLASRSAFGHTDLIIKGDFTLTHGILDALNSNDNTTGGTGTIIFNGEGPQNVSIIRTADTGFEGNLSFVIEEESELNLDESLLSNTTSGSLLVRGKLSLASTNSTGVMQAGSDGNINVTGAIQFDPGSVLELNGASQQFISYNNLSNAEILINNPSGVSLLNDVQAGGLTLGNGNLNINSYSFSITANVALQNGMITGSGALVLNGSSSQVLSGNGTSISNITVSKASPSDVTLSSPLFLTGLLSVLSTNSDIISNGNLTLVSTSEAASGTASIAALPSGSSIVGDVHVQRYMAGIGDKYRYISSPITTASVQSLKNAVPVTGIFADPSSGPGLNSTAPSLFEYDEVANQWNPFPTSGLAANNLFIPGRGYCYFNWNDTISTLWNVTGTVNQGDIPFTLTYTDDGDAALDGWNLIGNPYPGAIRWDNDGGWERNGSIATGIAVRDNAINGFRYWDEGIGGLPDGRIALGQSFWVRTTGPNPQLAIHESAKVTDGAAFYRMNNALDYVELAVRLNDQSDKTFLRLREEAQNKLDNYDIPKLANDNLSLSFVTDDSIRVAINAVDKIPCHLEIPLNLSMTVPASGKIFFSISTFGVFRGSDFHLFHEPTGETLELQAEESVITLPGTVTTLEGLRLIIDSPVPEEVKIKAPAFVCEEDSFKIQPETAQEGITYELIYEDEVVDDSYSGSFTMRGRDLANGSNVFRLAGRSTCSTRVMAESITIEKIITGPPEVTGGIACMGEKQTLSASTESSVTAYLWYETSFDTLSIHNGPDYVTPALLKSKTYFVTAVDTFGCGSQRIPVLAEVVTYDSVSIELMDGVLVSSYGEGNQWFFNGAELPGEVHQTLLPGEPGMYSVEVTLDPCRLSDEFDFVVTEVTKESRLDNILIYPRPCRDRLFIRFSSGINTELIDILSPSGISVYYLCHVKWNGGSYEVNTSYLPAGVYILRLRNEEGLSFIRFIKH